MMRRIVSRCQICLPVLLIGALSCAPALRAGAAPGDPNAAPTGTAAGEMPPAGLLKAIATLLSTSRFCSAHGVLHVSPHHRRSAGHGE